MPKVNEINGLRVVIYPNDHRPAHVHVIGKGCEAVFELNCPNGPPELRENYGFLSTEVAKIKADLELNTAYLCMEWSKIHGNPQE